MSVPTGVSPAVEVLFAPLTIQGVEIPNRIAMAPMTRSHSPGGVPGEDVAAYYRKRAEGGVGLIITEGIYIPHARAGFDPNVPRLDGEAVLDAWRRVTQGVHAAGGRIFAQLWHVGMQTSGGPAPEPGLDPVGPAMSQAEIDAVVEAYGKAAANARAAGFDGVEIHGAHGYLIDQFFWEQTNQRTDRYGGGLLERTRFAVDVIQEVRRRVGPGYPVGLRFSQWKIADYNAKLAPSPQDLERFLAPLAAAGVDVFHASTRRFWDAAFPDSDASLGLAGWTRKLTGKPVIAVGSVTLGADVMTSFRSPDAVPVTGIEELLARMQAAEFDMIAIGRSLIVNPDWAKLARQGALDRLRPYQASSLAALT